MQIDLTIPIAMETLIYLLFTEATHLFDAVGDTQAAIETGQHRAAIGGLLQAEEAIQRIPHFFETLRHLHRLNPTYKNQ